MLDQLGYTDALYKYIEEIYNPMLENYDKPREYLDKRNVKYKELIGLKNLLPYRYMMEVYKDRKDILDLLKK